MKSFELRASCFRNILGQVLEGFLLPWIYLTVGEKLLFFGVRLNILVFWFFEQA